MTSTMKSQMYSTFGCWLVRYCVCWFSEQKESTGYILLLQMSSNSNEKPILERKCKCHCPHHTWTFCFAVKCIGCFDSRLILRNEKLWMHLYHLQVWWGVAVRRLLRKYSEAQIKETLHYCLTTQGTFTTTKKHINNIYFIVFLLLLLCIFSFLVNKSQQNLNALTVNW